MCVGLTPSEEESNACLISDDGDNGDGNVGVCCPVDNNPNRGQPIDFASGTGTGNGEDVTVDSVSINDVDSIIGTR